MTTPKLEAERVSLSRTRTRAAGVEHARVLRDVSFGVGEGEAFGIIGPSGSGKTSLLRLLNGLESPDSGRVLLDGGDASEMDALDLRRKVGMVFQSPSLFPGSVASNVEYALELGGLSEAEREARGRRCLDRAGLPAAFWARDAAELSRGEQQRVSIARALAAEPAVLLMDEPTSALDPAASERILSLARSLNIDDGVTVVFVTHVLEQARRICARALVLIDGRGVEQGAIDTLFDDPAEELTRRFIEGTLDPCESGAREQVLGRGDGGEGTDVGTREPRGNER